MHCVIQTPDFQKDADDAGLSEDDILAIERQISENPMIGQLIKGTGGARKWRIPARGKGKRGGARVISYYAADDVPVFLLNVFAKGDRIDLSQRERNELKTILENMADDYRASAAHKIARLSETGT